VRPAFRNGAGAFRAVVTPGSARYSIGFHELPDMVDAVLQVISRWDEEIAIALK
jgi:hypothetical protein